MFTLFLMIILCQGIITDCTKYSTLKYPSYRCEKGERGDKGDPGFCPADCGWRDQAYSRNCLDPRINLERLAQSIRQLIIETKKIAHRNTRIAPCVCSVPPPDPISPVSNSFFLDYNKYIRLKGEKGNVGASCPSDCRRMIESNVRVFSTIQAAVDAFYTYPDHTYVHIVNKQGRLQDVFIRARENLVPLRLESEHAIRLPFQSLSTTIPIPKPQCSVRLSCRTLHMFALGPHTRQMCHPKRPNVLCSKLSDYDDLCGRISERHYLKGFYRAFMSTSTQWLANLFTGICMNAKIINMKEEVLFDAFDDIFKGKSPQNEILDIQGLKPRFQYWWHGSLPNGTVSNDTCLDWSRQDSSLSGLVSRMPNILNGLFNYQYAWPCSINDFNIGILCIETNCDKQNYNRH